jgi:hypothetical protein
MALSLCGCTKTPECFTGEWKFEELVSVELHPEIDQSTLEVLKETYGVEDEQSILESVFNQFAQDKTFSPFYLKFADEYAYTYDCAFERETTWFLYQLSDTTGFISIYSELEVTDFNPYPEINPDLEYDAQADVMYITMDYVYCYMVTIKLCR